MTESIKMGVKLLRYTWGLKTSLLMAGAFLAIGMITVLLPVGTVGMMSSYMLLVVSIWPAQMLWSLSTAHSVQVSPWKKRLQTMVPALTNGICFLMMYLLVLVIKVIQFCANPTIAQDVAFELLMDALMILIVMLYSGVSYKFFFPSTVIFVLVFMAFSVSAQLIRVQGVFAQVPLWAAVCSGFGAIILGTALQYGLGVLVYKFPLSRGAQLAGLRKWM